MGDNSTGWRHRTTEDNIEYSMNTTDNVELLITSVEKLFYDCHLSHVFTPGKLWGHCVVMGGAHSMDRIWVTIKYIQRLYHHQTHIHQRYHCWQLLIIHESVSLAVFYIWTHFSIRNDVEHENIKLCSLISGHCLTNLVSTPHAPAVVLYWTWTTVLHLTVTYSALEQEKNHSLKFDNLCTGCLV